MKREDLVGEIDYREKEARVIAFLDAEKDIVLATSLGDRVTARTVSFANDGLGIYLLSFNNHKKYVQISANNQVALCKKNHQIEGAATILGSPLGETNKPFSEIYKRKLPREFEIWSQQPGMELISVSPKVVTSLEFIDEWLYSEFLDIETGKAYRRFLGDKTE